MEFDNQIDNFQEQEERPSFLKVLCILSWISTGIALISGLFNLVTGPFSEEKMLEQRVDMMKSIDELKTLEMNGMAELFEKIQRMTESMNAQLYYVWNIYFNVFPQPEMDEVNFNSVIHDL